MKKIKLIDEQIEYIQYYLKNGILMNASEWEIKNYSEIAEIAEKRWIEIHNNYDFDGTNFLVEWLWKEYVSQEKDNRSFEGMLVERVSEDYGDGIYCHED